LVIRGPAVGWLTARGMTLHEGFRPQAVELCSVGRWCVRRMCAIC